MDNKYGRIFTVEDVQKIVERLVPHDVFPLDELIDQMDKGGVIFRFPPYIHTFVLVAKDKRALGAVRYYRHHQNPHAPSHHLNGLDKAVSDFENFRISHANLMKEPD